MLLVDDHPVVRRGLSTCLGRYPNLEIVGEAGDGREAISRAHELMPDVVLMDVVMPGMDGLSAAAALVKELPQIIVLMLTAHGKPEYVERAREAGARGFLLKEMPPEELVRAIESVQAGDSCFGPAMQHRGQKFEPGKPSQTSHSLRLNHRERRVVAQVARGFTTREIAGHLGIGVNTVRAYRESAMDKLNIRTTAGLARFAIASGWLAASGECSG